MNWLRENAIFLISTLVTAVITPIVVWFFSKKHYLKANLKGLDADVNVKNTDMLHKNFSLHLKMMDDIVRRKDIEFESFKKTKEQEIKILEDKIEELETLLKDKK